MGEAAFWISYCLLWALVLALAAVVSMLIGHYRNVFWTAPALGANQGPPEGDPLPERLSRALTDQGVHIGGGDSPAKLLLFVSTSCAPCKRVRDILRDSPDLLARGVEIVTVCRGRAPEILEYSSALPERIRVVPDPQGKLGEVFRVSGVPFAVLIDSTARVRAKGVPVTHEHFVALLDRVLPPLRVSGVNVG